jgi:hypothetical protein
MTPDTMDMLQAILAKLDDVPERMTRLEMEVKGLGERIAPLADVKERVLKLEQCTPENHLRAHERLENKMMENQSKVQSVINMGSVAINALIAWFVSQGLR